MRIDAYNQVSQIYSTTNTGVAKKTTAKETKYDQVQISQTGVDYQVAKQAMAGTSDIREELVAPLKEQVDAGEYEVSADDFASILYEKMNAL